jgi:hypothetical protein
LVHDATSTAANRFTFRDATNFLLKAGDVVQLIYDATTLRWRLATMRHTGTKRVWFGPDAFIITAGTPARAIVGGESAIHRMDGWAFDAAADEAISCNIVLPAEWDGGAITIKYYVSPTNTNTGSVRWAANIGDIIEGDQVDELAAHTVVNNFAMAGTAEDLEIETIGNFTPTSSFIRFNVLRAGSDAGDTYNADVIFHGLLLEYTAAF